MQSSSETDKWYRPSYSPAGFVILTGRNVAGTYDKIQIITPDARLWVYSYSAAPGFGDFIEISVNSIMNERVRFMSGHIYADIFGKIRVSPSHHEGDRELLVDVLAVAARRLEKE